jgi:hypothetical protein
VADRKEMWLCADGKAFATEAEAGAHDKELAARAKPLSLVLLCTAVNPIPEPQRAGTTGKRESVSFFDQATETNASFNLTALLDHGRLAAGKKYKITVEEVA